MRLPIARAIMTLAMRSLGDDRRDWGLAMHAEFETAVEDREALVFALGCLSAAWRAMPRRDEGRFVLASHLLAIGVVLPIAVLQISSVAFALPYPHIGHAGADGVLSVHAGQVVAANRSALPALALLTLALGIGQLHLAWAILRCDWTRVAVMTMLGAAGVVTLLAFTTVISLGEARAVFQAILMTTELAAVWSLTRWHAELPGATARP